MKLRKEALGIGALVMVVGAGCEGVPSENLEGKPISVAINTSGFATVVDVNGELVLAYTRRGSALEDVQATALIQSEIADGDNESIELRGRYESDGRTFVIDSLTANWYTVEF